jgi:hypothetical protein
MAYSSILGADKAPLHPSGRDSESLGPSDNTDSGSDTIGTFERHADSDAAGTGERGSVVARDDGREGADILPDRIARMPDGDGVLEGEPDIEDLTDLDETDGEEDVE